MVPKGRKVLISGHDGMISQTLGGIELGAQEFYVYVTCLGTGKISVSVEPATTATFDCATIANGSANQIQSVERQEATVSVTSRGDQRWSVAVAVDA